MAGLPSKLMVLTIAFGVLTTSSLYAQHGGKGSGGGGGVTPQIIGTEAHFNVSQFSPPATIPVEQSQVVTVQVHNYTATAGSFRITCSATGQLLCTSATPDDMMPLAANGYYNASITIHGYGLGSGSVTVKLYGSGGGDPLLAQSTSTTLLLPPGGGGGGGEVLDDSETRSLMVVGTPMVVHNLPADSGVRNSNIPMQASFNQPVTGVRVWMGTQEVTSSLNMSAAGYTVNPTQLAGGSHIWKTYACNATSSRCEYVTSSFYQAGSSAWELDDSLPLPNGSGIVGILGGLPLPPENLRGCPMQQSDPEIRLDQPSSFLSQPATDGHPGGLVFMASVTMNGLVTIKTVTVDHKDSDPTTCDDYGYLDRDDFNWDYWTGVDSTDPFWAHYPYTDPPLALGPTDLLWPDWLPELAQPPQVRGTSEPTPLLSSHVPGRWGAAGAVATLGARVPDVGAINPQTFKLTLNGTVLVDSGASVASGVNVVTLARNGATVTIPNSSSLLHAYDVNNPGSNYGGWNELVATISDSSGNQSSVRARFLHLPTGPASHLALTPLASFLKRDMGECAAFGPFQCGEVFLTQTIPGFVTRDKPRDLHLVYRSGSQRVQTILPIRVDIPRQNAAPDSLVVTPYVNGTAAGPALHYAGTKGSVSGAGALNLWDNADESRVFSAVVDNVNRTAPATIQRVNVAVKAYYGGATITDTVTQDIVQTSLVDTAMTRFGTGWQLAELSRLATGLMMGTDSAAVVLYGDGSYSVYRKTGNGAWRPPPGENGRLVKLATDEQGAAWVLSLDNGSAVGFRADGWQKWTRDLVGNYTNYAYSGSTQRLANIVDPSGRAFKFYYFVDSWQVQAVKLMPSLSGTPVWPPAIGIRYNCPAGAQGGAYSCPMTQLIYYPTDPWYNFQDTTRFTYKTDAFNRAMIDSVISPRRRGSSLIVQRFLFDDSLHTPSGFTGPGPYSYANFRDATRRAAPRMNYGHTGQPLERLLFPNQVRGTLVNATGRATDYQVDRFGAPTWVRRVSDGAIPGGFYIPSSAADDIRIIERDTLGRVTKIVHGDPVVTTPDSVMYRYDALSRVDTIIRNTLAYPKPVGVTLDTLTFAYDSVTLSTNGAWCSRLLWSKDALKVPTSIVYGVSGTARCLPSKIIAPGADTTIFTYGSLTAGTPSATRPISVRDGNGLTSSVTYESGTWNTSVVTAPGGPQSHVYYGTYGMPDSTRNPLGVVTRFVRDFEGRVIASKTGTGSNAPTTRTFYGKSGLVDSVHVYASSDAVTSMLQPLDSFVQKTRNFYDVTGQLDSVIGPGSRSTTGINRARKQSWIRDPLGEPVYSFVGNGSYLGTLYDWQGRPYLKIQSAVGNGTAVDGERFAEPGVQAAWDSLGVGMGRLSSAGQRYEYYYDAKGRLIDEVMHDEYLGDYRLLRHHGWSPVGQLTGDTVVFENGLATAARTLSYNRRGQRTGETDVVTVASGQQLTGDKGGAIRYVYDSLTARLSSMTHLMTTSTGASDTLATVSFLYDRGGRDTLRTVKLKGASAPVTRSTHYDSHGWPDHIVEKVGANVRYSFDNPVFSPLGEIRTATETRRLNTGLVRFNYDSTSWTRRLLTTTDGANSDDFYHWSYDRFGNRLTELHIVGGVNHNLSYTVGSDNRLLSQVDPLDPTTSFRRYLTDQAGQRLATLDQNTGVFGLWGVSTWTAAGQLYYSMTPETATGPYDHVWNWYDGSGRRFMTQLSTTLDRSLSTVSPTSGGFRTYYVYDGNDVAFTLVRPSTSTTWRIQQRYVNTGLDENVAARLWLNGTPTSLALVTDRQGGYIMGVRSNGTEELSTGFYLRNAFGKMESGSTAASSMETHTGLGFAGAGTPTSAGGGYIYMRNRWYDPQTGRFLSQDPIGLAGGVNLYAYAGNNPSSYSDPFGLCIDPGKPCKSLLQRAWNAFSATVDAVVNNFAPPALHAVGTGASASATRFIASTDVSATFTAGPVSVTTGITYEGTSVSFTPAVALMATVDATYTAPGTGDGVNISWGGVASVPGTPFVVGGSLNTTDARVTGGTVSVGVGVGIKTGLGRTAKALEHVTVQAVEERDE